MLLQKPTILLSQLCISHVLTNKSRKSWKTYASKSTLTKTKSCRVSRTRMFYSKMAIPIHRRHLMIFLSRASKRVFSKMQTLTTLKIEKSKHSLIQTQKKSKRLLLQANLLKKSLKSHRKLLQTISLLKKLKLILLVKLRNQIMIETFSILKMMRNLKMMRKKNQIYQQLSRVRSIGSSSQLINTLKCKMKTEMLVL